MNLPTPALSRPRRGRGWQSQSFGGALSCAQSPAGLRGPTYLGSYLRHGHPSMWSVNRNFVFFVLRLHENGFMR